jgi:hypothetical protein
MSKITDELNEIAQILETCPFYHPTHKWLADRVRAVVAELEGKSGWTDKDGQYENYL